MKNVILTGFNGKNNSARIITEKVNSDCTKLILPNHKEKSAELLLKAIRETDAVCVVMLGQKPRIKAKIAVEPTAERYGKTLHTPLDCTVTAEILKENGYDAYISGGCGNSYCNHIYYECLSEGVNAVFLHVPVIDNIPDINAVIKAVEGYINGLDRVPCTL